MSSVDGVNEEEASVAARLPARRSGHVSVALESRVLIWGGYTDIADEYVLNGRYLPSDEIWIYDMDIEQWSCQLTKGDPPPGLSGSCAVLIGHRMYIICGHGAHGNLNDVHILDTRTWTWSCVVMPRHEDRPSPRDKFTAWQYDNMLYMFGGYGLDIFRFLHDNGEYFEDPSTSMQALSRGWNNQLFVFNPSAARWENPKCQGSVPSPRAAHAVAQIERKLFLFGGRHNDLRLNDLYHLDLTTLTWSRIFVTGDLPAPRTWHIFCPIGMQYVFLHGGYSQHPPEIENGEPLDDAWLFDTVSHQWTSVSWFEGPACLWHTSVQTSDESVVLFGGCTGDIFSTYQQNHSNKMCVFRLSPKSLFSLSVDAGFRNREKLGSEWKQLPKDLSSLLHDRVARLHKAYCNSTS